MDPQKVQTDFIADQAGNVWDVRHGAVPPTPKDHPPRPGVIHMVLGALCFLGGIAAAKLTGNIEGPNDGWIHFVAWGAMGVGALYFMLGFMQSMGPKK